MKKRILSGLLAFCLVFGSAAALPEGVFETSTTITASAEVNTATSGTCGENLTWTLNDGLLTISGTGRMTNYKYNESPFLNRTDIQTITIKNGVENIGNYAFKGCTNLVSITMPNSVGTIGHYALMECKKLMELTIPSNVTYIGEYAFESCITLTSVVIPDKVMHIGDCAFRGCINLVDITIPSKASIIGGNAFAATKWLEKKREENPLVVVNDILIDAQTYEGILNIPDTIIDIAANAFYTNEKLTGVTIPSSIEEIRDSAFKGCKGLTSITIPDSVRWIDDNAFRNCENLQTITLSSNLEQIGKYCFAYCTKLTKVIVPDSVTYIGDGAFSYCKNLTSVTLSNSIINIDYLTFNGCSNLKSVTIPENVTKIEDGAFEDCTNLTSVNVPSSVKTIGKDSFDKECTIICEKGSAAETYAKGNGNEIIYSEPDYLYKELDDGTVQIIEYTGKIAELTIPSKLPKAQKKVTSIGPSAFFTNTRLKSVTIPNGVTSIDTYAFCNCSNLTSVNIPNSVTSIGVSAFGNCPSLTSITIPSDVTSIASCTFSLCTSLKSITIPSNVTNIDSSAFSDCTSLKSVTIPSSVTSIGSVAFGYTSGGKVDDFTIKALKGTAAEQYATDNGFAFEALAELKITKQPTNVTVAKAGDTASFSVTSTGNGLKYEWYVKDPGGNWTKTGATSNKYSVSITAARNGRQVFCKVIDSSGAFVKSNIVTAKYVEKFAITKQPTNVVVTKAGNTASFSVTATGVGLKYEWYIKDIGGSWTKVGSTSNKYSVALKDARNGRQVFCKVIDSTGAFLKSDIVTATIKGTVVITKQPTNVTVSKAGNTASFTVTALGSNLKYEWYIKDPGGKWTKTGATSNKYSVSVTAARNGRQVFCKVIDSSTKNFAKSNTVTAKIK